MSNGKYFGSLRKIVEESLERANCDIQLLREYDPKEDEVRVTRPKIYFDARERRGALRNALMAYKALMQLGVIEQGVVSFLEIESDELADNIRFADEIVDRLNNAIREAARRQS